MYTYSEVMTVVFGITGVIALGTWLAVMLVKGGK